MFVALTAPYMHDGRFDSLKEVLDHYQSGVKWSANLDRRLLANFNNTDLPLNENEKRAILVFLDALTAKQFLDE
ncbi:hypothetical protein [Olivibacter jilunii]|uniref:hypothetical protein n=1 Tax=Olivibacter jilunii TaxID=985016 RepID=UPI003F18C13B